LAILRNQNYDAEARELAATMLTNDGFRILKAANAADALRLFDEERERIDLVLTDVVSFAPPRYPIRRSYNPLSLIMWNYANRMISRDTSEFAALPEPLSPDDGIAEIGFRPGF
jgi:hypothetical protein